MKQTFSKNAQISDFIQIRLEWEPSCSMRAEERRDMTKLTTTF
jgi:hypothetical protein